MADTSLNDVNYGRPGLTIYDLDDRDWFTSRRTTSDVLQQVADWQLAIPAAIRTISAEAAKNATDKRKDVRRLMRSHTQLVPAANQLFELNAISEGITFATSTYDPNVGDLLSFGTVFLKQFVRPKRLAALPTGPSGSILRLVPMARQKQGWEGDKSVWLSGPSFNIVDSGYWNEEAAPIQQICFAQARNSNSFLAVRLLSKTILFRPLYHRGRRAAEPSRHYDLPPSLISARPIFHLTLEQTGVVPHADVAFNPDYQFQFGIIDQSYRWSLWQIERRAKREEYTATRMLGGDILAEDNNQDDGDGWARISWAGDSNTLIVCNRRHLSVISIKGPTFEYLEAPPVIPKQSTDWILDIKRHSQHQNQFFVLTSTRLFLIAVTTSDAAIDNTAGPAGATVILSRRHYRGDEDITMRMSVQAPEAITYLFITSRLNRAVQVFQFKDNLSPFTGLVATSDPVAMKFNLPTAASISQMHLQVLDYGTKEVPPHRRKNASAQSYWHKKIPFYQLTAILTDSSVYQTVMLSTEHDSDPESLFWRRIIVAKHSLDARTEVDEVGDFVEPDGPDWDADPELKLKSQMLRRVPFPGRTTALATADHTALYDALVRVDDSTEGSISLGALADQLRGLMREGLDSTESRHIMEIVDRVEVSDIDEGSMAVDQLFAAGDALSTHSLRPIAAPHVLHLPQAEQSSIANTYDTILHNWIAPLPADIPVPIRQAKERLSRRLAAEVILAGACLESRDDEQTAGATQQSLSLPILPSKPADLMALSLPTPPQSSVPPSSPLFPEPPQPPTSDPLSRLRKHLRIDASTPMIPTVLPQSVSELLSHWQPGSDPNLYDWETTERTLQPDGIDEETQETRERERRRKERREKRQKREDELMRAKHHTSSQPTFPQPAAPRSSPGPVFGGMATSSQVPVPTSSQMTSNVYGHPGGLGGFGRVTSILQSQVEPGKFGGRPDKKKKKGKSRVSGF